MAYLIVNSILTSTLPTNFTTTEASIFGENGLTLVIIGSILILIGLMFLCCFCASHPSGGGNVSRRSQSVLPVQAPPPQTTVIRTQSTIYANPKGQPILKTYKVSTHSTSSGESIHAMQSQTNLLPAASTAYNYQNQNQIKNNSLYDQIANNNTNPFYEVPLDTVSAPRKLTHDYYQRRGLQQYSSDI